MKLKGKLLSGTALGSGIIVALGLSGSPAFTADLAPVVPPPPAAPVAVRLPAVSGLNAKIDIAAGAFRLPIIPLTLPVYRAQGAVSVPLGHSFGLQIDGAVAMSAGFRFTHLASHLFWRDPAVGLAGTYASYSNLAGLNRWRVAGQAEAYLGKISLEAIVGMEFGTLPPGLFVIADAAFYPTDNLRLSVGFRHNGLLGSALAVGAEFQFASGQNVGAAAFVDGEIGGNYQRIFGGIRLYFGDDKSLIRRHREDDPRIHADTGPCIGAFATDGLTALDGAVIVDGAYCGPPR